MHCDTTLLTLYWSGELSEQETAQIEEHLATCEACRQELAELNAIQVMVADMPQERAPRDFVEAAASPQLEPQHKVITFLRKPAVAYPTFGAIAMAAAILIVLMGPWFGTSPVLTDGVSLAIRQPARELYTKVTTANRHTATRRASIRRASNFRARAGSLAKKIQLTKRLAYSRSRTQRFTR